MKSVACIVLLAVCAYATPEAAEKTVDKRGVLGLGYGGYGYGIGHGYGGYYGGHGLHYPVAVSKVSYSTAHHAPLVAYTSYGHGLDGYGLGYGYGHGYYGKLGYGLGYGGLYGGHGGYYY